MNLAWEAALRADKSGIDREELRYVPTQNGSPYTEVALEYLNENQIEQSVVEINPLNRFAKIYSKIFDINLKEYQKSRDVFFDIYIHYIVQLDLRQGLSRKEYQLRYILKELLEDVCQINSETVIRQIEKEKLPLILRMVWKLYRCGSSIALFREAMRLLYPYSIIYENKEEANYLLIYIGEKEGRKNRERFAFLQAVFLPINVQVYLFWERHFGIIGIDETMVLDEMVLF